MSRRRTIRVKYCDFCGEITESQPCEVCGADEEKIHNEMLEREDRDMFRRLAAPTGKKPEGEKA